MGKMGKRLELKKAWQLIRFFLICLDLYFSLPERQGGGQLDRLRSYPGSFKLFAYRSRREGKSGKALCAINDQTPSGDLRPAAGIQD